MHLLLGSPGGILDKEYSTVCPNRNCPKPSNIPCSQSHSSTSLSRNLRAYTMCTMFLFCWISANCVYRPKGWECIICCAAFDLCMAFICAWIKARQLVSFLLCLKLRAPGHGRERKSNILIVLHFCLVYTNLAFTHLFLHS